MINLSFDTSIPATGASNYTHPYVLFGLFAQLPVRIGGGQAPRRALRSVFSTAYTPVRSVLLRSD